MNRIMITMIIDEYYWKILNSAGDQTIAGTL